MSDEQAPQPIFRTALAIEPATDTSEPPRKPLSDAAKRALAEAEARRAAQTPVERPPELHGRDGPDPARYDDWEVKGIAVDF